MVLNEKKKIPKNLSIYPLYLGEAPQLFAFVLVLKGYWQWVGQLAII